MNRWQSKYPRTRGLIGFGFLLGALASIGDNNIATSVPSPIGFLVCLGVGAYLILTAIPMDN